jgi:hypothetical protein
MAISKRLRYEILRRDNYTCRYCGRSTPDVSLTIDHVVPESLGRSDTPPNLVTACSDCNSGKTSSMPDSPLVAAVADDAARWGAAMKQAVEENRINDNTAIHEAVVRAWTSYRRSREIPTDYKETIDRILAAGLPAEDVVAMARVADAKASVKTAGPTSAGVVGIASAASRNAPARSSPPLAKRRPRLLNWRSTLSKLSTRRSVAEPLPDGSNPSGTAKRGKPDT